MALCPWPAFERLPKLPLQQQWTPFCRCPSAGAGSCHARRCSYRRLQNVDTKLKIFASGDRTPEIGNVAALGWFPGFMLAIAAAASARSPGGATSPAAILTDAGEGAVKFLDNSTDKDGLRGKPRKPLDIALVLGWTRIDDRRHRALATRSRPGPTGSAGERERHGHRGSEDMAEVRLPPVTPASDSKSVGDGAIRRWNLGQAPPPATRRSVCPG